jgi:hypothetical protein
MDTIMQTVGWIINSAAIAWVVTLFFLLLSLRIGKGALVAFLMKMYEFFILRNLINL